jgi:exo-beta-1,3-glucanase (GH17 family)
MKFVLPLTLFFVALSHVKTEGVFPGMNYATGQMMSQVPDDRGLSIVGTWGIRKLKFYWRDIAQLEQVRRHIPDAEVAIAFQNHELWDLATDPTSALRALSPFSAYDDVVKFVCVGNEVDTSFSPDELEQMLVKAMENSHAALMNLGMHNVRVVTPLTMQIVGWENITPPSKTVFVDHWDPFVLSLLDFLRTTDSVFMINMYPYLSWLNHPDKYSLEYALFDGVGYVDGVYTYYSLLEQQIDAVHYALENAGQPLSLVIGETGWPSEGAAGASETNACLFQNRIISLMTNTTTRSVTKHHAPTPFYFFEAFDESLKPGDGTERHYGIAREDGNIKYPVHWK